MTTTSGQNLPQGDKPVESGIAPSPYSRRYLLYVMLLLAVVNVFNFMDRTVISVLMPSIKADLHLNDTELGLLSGLAFALFYATLGIPLAAFADKTVRRNIIAVALVVWSGMTAMCGLVQNFTQLFLARMGVGVGEAGCLPTSHSMIGDYFPPKRRSSALAVHTAGSTVGIMIGLMLGGYLVQTFGWRETFVILGLPGIILAALAYLTLKEPRRGASDVGSERGARDGEPRTLIELIRMRPSYFQLVMVFAGGGFVSFGLQQWLPSFYVRSYDMTISEVGLVYGAISGVASTLGVVIGGFVGDRMIARGFRGVLIYGIVCYLLAFIFKIAMLLSDTATLSLSFNFLTSVCALGAHGPAFALIQVVTPPHLRARATALLTFLTALIGTGAGPFFIGLVSDLYAGTAAHESLRYALLWCSGLALWPVVHLWLARKWIDRDAGRPAATAPAIHV